MYNRIFFLNCFFLFQWRLSESFGIQGSGLRGRTRPAETMSLSWKLPKSGKMRFVAGLPASFPSPKKDEGGKPRSLLMTLNSNSLRLIMNLYL